MSLDETRGPAHQAAIYIASNIVSRVFALVLVPALTFLLTPPEYGKWGVATAWANLASLLFLFGLYTPVSQLYFEETEAIRRRQLYGTLFLFQLFGGGIAAGITICLVRAFIADQERNLQLAICVGYFTSFNLIPLALMRVREQAKQYAMISVIVSAVTTTGPLMAVLVDSRSAHAALAGLAYGSGFAALLYAWLLRRDVSLHFSAARLTGILRYSVQFIPHTLAAWVLNLSDRVVVQTLLGPAMAGIYSAGYTLASGVSLVIEGIGHSWLTLFLKSEQQAAKQPSMIAAATYFVGAAALCAMGAALFIPLLVRLTLPDNYADAERVAILVALALMLTAPYLVWVYAIMTVRKITAFPLVTIVAACSNVGLNLWLVPRVGILAAAINTVLGYGVQAALTGVIAARINPIQHEYGRWSAALGTVFGIGVLELLMPRWPIGVEVAWRVTTLVTTPILFVWFGFFRSGEVAVLTEFLHNLIGRSNERRATDEQ